MNDEDITQLQLDVYMTRNGPWNPEHGEIEIPDDWEFLPSGDAFMTRRVTRRVKAAGTYIGQCAEVGGRLGRHRVGDLKHRRDPRRAPRRAGR